MNKNVPIGNTTGQEYLLQLHKELNWDNSIGHLVLQSQTQLLESRRGKVT